MASAYSREIVEVLRQHDRSQLPPLPPASPRVTLETTKDVKTPNLLVAVRLQINRLRDNLRHLNDPIFDKDAYN